MSRYIFDIETTGLNAISDRIICITMKDVETKDVSCFIGENEKIILEQALSKIKPGDFLVGYNSDTFDIPFIIKRALINDVVIPDMNTLKLIDLRKIANSFHMTNNIYEKGTLRDWANIMGFEYKTLNGSEMPAMWLNKEFDKIKAHNIEDVELTYLLLKKMVRCKLLADIE